MMTAEAARWSCQDSWPLRLLVRALCAAFSYQQNALGRTLSHTHFERLLRFDPTVRALHGHLTPAYRVTASLPSCAIHSARRVCYTYTIKTSLTPPVVMGNPLAELREDYRQSQGGALEPGTPAAEGKATTDIDQDREEEQRTATIDSPSNPVGSTTSEVDVTDPILAKTMPIPSETTDVVLDVKLDKPTEFLNGHDDPDPVRVVDVQDESDDEADQMIKGVYYEGKDGELVELIV